MQSGALRRMAASVVDQAQHKAKGSSSAATLACGACADILTFLIRRSVLASPLLHTQHKQCHGLQRARAEHVVEGPSSDSRASR